MFSNVTYIEHELRPKLAGLVGREVFWQYEPFKDRERGKSPMINELVAPILAIILTAAMIQQTWPLSTRELVTAGMAVVLIVKLWERWLTVIRLRRHFVEPQGHV